MQYIINAYNPFDGNAIATMSKYPFIDGTQHAFEKRKLTLDEYQLIKPDIHLKVIDTKKMIALIQDYEESLMTKWIEVSEETYVEMKESFPPSRDDGNCFFMSENIYGLLTTVYAIHNGKYYHAIRNQFDDFEDIYASLNTQFYEAF